MVETVLAVGIVTFAFVPLFGLLPTGLGVFRAGMADTVRSQIAQRLVSDCQQTDFDTLSTQSPNNRYFDNDGVELVSTDPAVIAANSIYTARANILPQTALRESTASKNLLSVQIQIAINPGSSSDPFAVGSQVPVVTYVAFVARNLYTHEGASN